MKSVWNSALLALSLAIAPVGTIVLAVTPVSAEEIVKQTAENRAKSPNPSAEALQKLRLRLEESYRQQKLIEADQLYLGGQFAAAEKIYRQVKTPFASEETRQRPTPILDPAQLSPAAKVYWREVQAGTAQNLQTRVMVPLRLLVEQYPEFIPAHLRLATALQEIDHPKEAIDVLERATTLYPNQPDLVRAKVAALAASEKWMEASLAARQFALLNSTEQDAPVFTQLADEHLERYKSHLRAKLRGNAIANVITGALGYALTGSLFGPFSAVQTTTMLLRGESAVGESIAKQAREQLELVQDKEVLNYVNEIGQKLAHVASRDDFDYEFNVVLENDLNAFALPGGKVFINAGAITRTNSEAELAGLVAHELSHAVLSHGFQLVAEGNLASNVTQFFPLGGTVANLLTLNYSREMERQADTLGTRLITSTGYAADGMRNLMVTLEQQQKSSPPSWLASHPETEDRIRYLENLIERNGYNRYAYEGVARHVQIQERVKKIIKAEEQRQKKKHQ